MADTNLVIGLSVRLGKMEEELQKATRSMRSTERQAKQTAQAVASIGPGLANLGSSVNGAFRAVGATVAGIVAVVAGGGIIAGISAAVTRVNALADAASQVGVEVEALQAIQIGFEEGGSNAQAAEQALGRLGTAIGDAASGSKEAQETFKRMGISFRNVDGSVRSTVDAFDDIARKINAAESEQEKLSIAATFFGARGARAAVAAMGELSGSTAEATQRLREMGLVVGADTAANLDKIGTSFANLGRAISVIMANALSEATPAITGFIDRVRESIAAAGPTIVAQLSDLGSQIGAAVSGYWEEFRPLREALVRLFNDLAPIAVNFGRIVAETFAGVARTLQPVAVFIIDTLRDVIRWVTDALKALGLVERSGLEVAQRGVRAAFDAAVTATSSLTQAEERLAAVRANRGTPILVLRQAEEDVAKLRLAQAGATVALTDAQRALNAARGSAPQVPTAPTTPAAPTVRTAPPGAPPVVTAGGGAAVRETEAQREANRLLSESYRDLTKIQERAADPQIRMQAALGEVTRAIMEQDRAFAAYREAYGRAPADIEPLTLSLETLTSVAEKAAEDVAKAMQGTGSTTAQITAAITQHVTAFAEELARTGRITTEQIDAIVAAAQNAGQRVTRTGFLAGLQTGAGVDPEKAAPDFVTELGKGFGQIGVGLFDQIAASLDKVATGAMSAGDAMKAFALDFVKAVSAMILKAAALAAIQALIRGFSGTGSVGGGPKTLSVASFGGFRAAGGPVSSGRAYIVGERGPELFVPTASGQIVPNGGGDPVSLTIVNNAPGVVIDQTRSDERTIALAVNISRQRVASDFTESARTGHGAYAESLSSRYAMRRRV